MRNLGFKQRFLLLGVLVAVGFTVLLLVGFAMLDRVMVNGELYEDVVAHKDLVADILPPPAFLVGPYLLCHRIAAEKDSQKKDELIGELEAATHEYRARLRFWEGALADGPLKQDLIQTAGKSGLEFVRLAEEAFLPAARAGTGEGKTPDEILDQVLEPAFRAHHTGILAAVKRANAVILADEQVAADAVSGGRQLALTVGLVVVVVLLAAGFFVVRSVLTPINRLNAQLGNLAVGEADLGARIDIDSKDEVGDLARSFNTFVAKIAALVQAVRKSSIQLTSSSTEMAATSREQESTITGFGSSTSQIAASVQQISATGTELMKTIGEVTGIAHDAAGLAGTGRGQLETMETTMGQLQESSASISDKLSVINDKAGDITSVVTTITKVADQTNLLSVNAAIEAEKAGEYGRGFLVVAQEIRRLADQTAGATLDIEHTVQEMQTAVSSGVMEMDKFSDRVRRSVESVAQVAAQLGEIITQVQSLTSRFDVVGEGMRSQAQGAEQIHEAMGALNEAVQQAVTSLREVTSVAEDLRGAATTLNGEIGKFRLED